MLCCAVSFCICLMLSASLYGKRSEDDLYNQARILLQDDMEEIKNRQEGEQQISEKTTHAFYLVGIDGVVILSTDEDMSSGEKLNLTKELQMDHAFSKENEGSLKVVFPILKKDVIKEFAVFTIEERELAITSGKDVWKCLLPLGIWGCAVILFMGIEIYYMNRKVLEPMEEMAESSKGIIAGDYTREIVQQRVKDRPKDQIESLIYSFEMMRDELRNKAEREGQLKREQKELLSCMSHDLRTPITTIQAHAEAIRDGIVRTEDKKKEYLETIIRKTEVLNRMIADLLDHSNAELNQLKIVKREIYFGPYMEELEKELRAYCEKGNCRFSFENDVENVLVNMDEGRITQVIYNLMENACKYMEKKNQTLKNLPSVKLCCHRDVEERRIYISICDNGPGIELSDVPYVFERFYRAEKSRSMQIPGAGLGLSICKYIVEAHEGEISLQSRKGRGTEVTFFLTF